MLKKIFDEQAGKRVAYVTEDELNMMMKLLSGFDFNDAKELDSSIPGVSTDQKFVVSDVDYQAYKLLAAAREQ